MNTDCVRKNKSGIEKILKTAENFKIHHKLNNNLSMSLGAGLITLKHLTNAYAMIVNGGKEIDPILIQSVYNKQGKIIINNVKVECDQCIQTSDYIDYTIHASVFNEQQIYGMKFCNEKGISSFKVYMNLGGEIGHVYMDMNPGENKLIESKVNMNNQIVEKIVQQAASLNCPVLVHAEDYQECDCAINTAKQKKQDGLLAWSQSRSPDFEAKSIKTVCEYARKYNCVVYFVHIGSTSALEQINQEKQQGTKIFVETCPHYLTLSHESQEGYLAKVMPPIRSKNDIASVWSAIAKNQIDTIGTDHVANQLKLKLGGEDVWGALAGFPGIGTSLPILLSEGINKNRLNLNQLVNLTSRNASKIFGLKSKGSLDIDFDADVAIIDLKKETKVSSDLFGGFSDYLVYDGWNLKGWPVKTIVRGTMIVEDFEVIGKPGFGKFISRTS